MPAALGYSVGLPAASPVTARSASAFYTATAASKPLKLGIVGGGTVGGGIVEILGGQMSRLKPSLGIDVQIAKISVRDKSKKRDFELPAGCELTTDPMEIVNDDEIDLVVEVMGGVDLAKEVVVQSLQKGKHVVTANKALIAQDLPELQALLKQVNEGKSKADEVSCCCCHRCRRRRWPCRRRRRRRLHRPHPFPSCHDCRSPSMECCVSLKCQVRIRCANSYDCCA